MQQDKNFNIQPYLKQIREILHKNSSGIIVLPVNPQIDTIAASTALYLALNKMGKVVALICSSKPQAQIVGVEKIQQSLSVGGDSLVISFPYTEGSVDRVDYDDRGGKFSLIIVPRPGYPKLQPDKVEFSYTGGKIEFIFTIDVPSLQSIGQIYQQNQREFTGRTIINIDRHFNNINFGIVNLVNKTSSSTSEIVLQLIEGLQIEVDKDIATNLYAGLVAATNNFSSYSVNQDTFQNAAKLLRYGAVKRTASRPMPMTATQPFNQSPFTNPFGLQPLGYPSMTPPPVDNYESNYWNQPPPPRYTASTNYQNEQQSRPIEEVERAPAIPKQDMPQPFPRSTGSLKPRISQKKGLI